MSKSKLFGDWYLGYIVSLLLCQAIFLLTIKSYVYIYECCIYLWMLFQLLVPYLLQREPKLIFAQRFDRFSLHCVNHLRSPFLLHLQHAWITSKWNSTLCWALWCVSPAPRGEACFLNHWFLLITYSFIFPIYFFCSVCSQPHSTTLHITSL